MVKRRLTPPGYRSATGLVRPNEPIRQPFDVGLGAGQIGQVAALVTKPHLPVHEYVDRGEGLPHAEGLDDATFEHGHAPSRPKAPLWLLIHPDLRSVARIRITADLLFDGLRSTFQTA